MCGISTVEVEKDNQMCFVLWEKIIGSSFPLAIASSREATVGYGKKAPVSRRSRMSSCQ